MGNYRLSRDARRDIKDIAEYSLENFGRDRAFRYRDSLFAAIERLAQYPQMGADFSYIRPDYRRMAHESHVVYYRITITGIFVLRIPHSAQDPARHL